MWITRANSSDAAHGRTWSFMRIKACPLCGDAAQGGRSASVVVLPKERIRLQRVCIPSAALYPPPPVLAADKSPGFAPGLFFPRLGHWSRSGINRRLTTSCPHLALQRLKVAKDSTSPTVRRLSLRHEAFAASGCALSAASPASWRWCARCGDDAAREVRILH